VAMMKLTYDRAALSSKINSMQPNGNTNQGQSRPFGIVRRTSGLPSIADIGRVRRHVDLKQK
jgi:hypothetical protein